MRMAADQLNKRSNATSSVGYNSREQHRVKKKKLESNHDDLSMRSSISLEWDNKKRSVIAKREQISISRSELIPFYVPHSQSILADVFTAPREIFELKNLTDVLSFEVWQNCLSEKERKLLTQLLPKGVEAHKIVQELLGGNNFNFGNPFLKWGASLCSGGCHPDAVLRQEQCTKANKRAYYSELRKCHTNMIGNLQKWKERWLTCKNSEKEFMQKIWRSNKDCQKSGSIHADESGLCDLDENVGATSESCSWAVDEKACSSDSPYLTTVHGEIRPRICRLTESKYYDSSDGHKVIARLGKGKKVQKSNVECVDVAKYMSYIKVSKEQHRRVKSTMKHPSSSIQPRSLNHVLGNLDTFCVQPYEIFEEEERQKLHDYWSQLAKQVLPVGFENWRKWLSEKRQLTKSLGVEMKEKVKYLEEDGEKEDHCSTLLQQTDIESSDLEPIVTMEDEEPEKSGSSLLPEQVDDGEANHEPFVTSERQADSGATNHEPAAKVEDKDEPGHASAQKQPLQRVALLGDGHNFCSMDVDTGNSDVLAKTSGFPPTVSDYTENVNNIDVTGQGNRLSTNEVWPAVALSSDYYHHPASVNREYAPTSELPLRHPQIRQEQQTQVIDLESAMQDQGRKSDFLHTQSGSGESFFSPYTNHDRNELLLQSLLKNPEPSQNHHEQKQTALGFHPTGSSMMLDTGHISGNLRDPSMLLELRQKRLNDLYMHESIQENMFANGGSRFSIPRQEHFSPLNHIQDWAVNSSVNMPPSSHSHLNGGELLNQNWFPGEHRPRDGWSGSEVVVDPNQSFGNGSNASDQSLFSVLSQCNGLRQGVPFDSLGTSERFMQSGNYGGVAGGGVPMTSNLLRRPANSLNYLGGHEAASGLRTNSLGWMSLPHQNTALQDSVGKTFLRSWNQ